MLRSLSSQLLVPLLATLLVLTTPVGTGQGIHANELLHPLLPHVHLIGGRVVFGIDAVMATDSLPSRPHDGPALGAGGGAADASSGVAIGPAPLGNAMPAVVSIPDRLGVLIESAPTEFRELPEDPPPNPIA